MKTKTKKGQLQLGGALVDFWSYIVFVLVILLFFLVFQIKSCSIESTYIDSSLNLDYGDTDTNLLAYLRTPFNEKQTIADALTSYYLNQDETQHAQLLKLTKDIFDPLEYCYKPNNEKLKRGYAISITEDIKEGNLGFVPTTKIKLSSESFSKYSIKNKEVWPLPLPNKKILYVIVSESGINAVSSKYKDCPIIK